MPKRVYYLPLERSGFQERSHSFGYQVTAEAWAAGKGRGPEDEDCPPGYERHALCEGPLALYYEGLTGANAPERIHLAVQPLGPREALPTGANEAWRMHDAMAVVMRPTLGREGCACMLDPVDTFLDQCGVPFFPEDTDDEDRNLEDHKVRGGRYAWWVELG